MTNHFLLTIDDGLWRADGILLTIFSSHFAIDLNDFNSFAKALMRIHETRQRRMVNLNLSAILLEISSALKVSSVLVLNLNVSKFRNMIDIFYLKLTNFNTNCILIQRKK